LEIAQLENAFLKLGLKHLDFGEFVVFDFDYVTHIL